MLNIDFLEVPENRFFTTFVHDFLRKIFLMLYSINCLNFIA